MPSFSPAFSRGKPREQGDLIALWFGVDTHLDSTRNTWDYLNRKGTVPHFLWHPSTGELVAGAPLDHTGTMWSGSYAVCVAVVCDPADPFTDYPLRGAESLCEALRSAGVPEVWPLGPPSSVVAPRAVRGRLEPGHYSIDQIGKAPGIGAVDIARLFRARANA
jgi:hypothetical protein